MIRARFFHAGGRLCGFAVSGHAGYAAAGRDIVCAGVSSAVQMAANTVTEVLRAGARVRTEGDTVELLLAQRGAAEQEKAVQAVLEGLRLQLETLSRGHRGTIRVETRLRAGNP